MVPCPVLPFNPVAHACSAIIVAGVGFYTDAYDLFAVNFANIIVGYVYYSTSGGVLPTTSDTALKIATVAGTVVGQLGFGFLADHLGRKKVSQT